jgi:hypothetical protein
VAPSSPTVYPSGSIGQATLEPTRGTGLSVCMLTSGRAPERAVAILQLLREVADEIVVAVDDRCADSAVTLATVADRVLLFTHEDPGDRPIAFLVGACTERWILNVDDDEVPSPALLRRLPALLRRRDVSHYWIARRWLYPDARRYLDEPPWSNEFQLRLFSSDPRLVRFTRDFHLPVVCHGPSVFVEEPLWHLDMAINSEEHRRAKAIAYERERRGMRVGQYSHNAALYLPELRRNPALGVVAREDAASIDRVLRGGPAPGPAEASIEQVAPSRIAAAWPGPPYAEDFYDAQISLREQRVEELRAGVQQTIDLRVENLGSATWRSEHVTLGTRWPGQTEGIRTRLPADVRPHSSTIVPLHVVAPTIGRQVLEIDLVHEHVRWFGVPLRIEVVALPRRRVLVAGDGAALEAALDAIALAPEIEPVIVENGDALPPGHDSVSDPARHLFGSAGTDSALAVLRGGTAIVGARLRRSSPFVDEARDAEWLVVAGYDGGPHVAPTRQRFGVLTLSATARAAGCPVVVITDGRTPAPTRIDRLLDRLTLARSRRVSLADLPELMSKR